MIYVARAMSARPPATPHVLRRGGDRSTHQHPERHDPSPDTHRQPPPGPIDDQHLNDRAPDLQRALDAAGQQAQPPTQPQHPEQRRQVILHGRGAAHLRHELEEGRAPEPAEEGALGEQGPPGEPRGAEGLDAAADARELGLDLVGGVGACAEVREGLEGAAEVVVLDEPARTAAESGVGDHIT